MWAEMPAYQALSPVSMSAARSIEPAEWSFTGLNPTPSTSARRLLRSS
jgi:hypothetical protein